MTLRLQPDVVITDIEMPEMTGLELARRIRAVRQDIPILLVTGYPNRLIAQEGRAAGVQEILEYGLLGIAMSRFTGGWVALKCVHDTVESTASITVDPALPEIRLPDDFELPLGGLNIRWPDDGIGQRMALAQEARVHTHKLDAARAFARANRLDRVVVGGDGAWFGVVTTTWAFSGVLSMGPFPIVDRIIDLMAPLPQAAQSQQGARGVGRGGRGGSGGPNIAGALRGRGNATLSAYEEKDPRAAIASDTFGSCARYLARFSGDSERMLRGRNFMCVAIDETASICCSAECSSFQNRSAASRRRSRGIRRNSFDGL